MKTIIFDLGNVLINVDADKLTRNLKNIISGSDEKLDEFEKKFHRPFYTGNISAQEFYNEFNLISANKVTYDEFRLLWSDIFSYNQEMIEYVSKLPQNEIRIIIASNTDPIHIEYIFENYNLPFEYLEFYSYDEGLLKPEDGFYQKLISKYFINLSQAIFFDDLEQNVNGAIKNGIDSYVHSDNENTVKRIKTFLSKE